MESDSKKNTENGDTITNGLDTIIDQNNTISSENLLDSNEEPQTKNEIKTFYKTINWWITILLAIPLAVIANLMTPPVSNYFSQFSEKRAEQRIIDTKCLSGRPA